MPKLKILWKAFVLWHPWMPWHEEQEIIVPLKLAYSIYKDFYEVPG